MKKFVFNILALICTTAFIAPALVSCSEDMSEENYYTFTGKMMSEYLKQNPDYSLFASIVEKAGLMDQLSAYGRYTCFAPDNNAINTYLASKNLTLESLSREDCDTLARVHLISAMYSISEMPKGTLDQNMMGRNIDISYGTDEQDRSVVIINGKSRIYFEHQDDSVENGIVQPVNVVIENSSKSVDGLLDSDPNLAIYSAALKATGLDMVLQEKEDLEWAKNYKALAKKYNDKYVTGSRGAEACEVPKTRKKGFTLFAVPDAVLNEKYGVYNVHDLYELACSIYDNDEVYGLDKASDSHKYENVTDPKNPLYRFMAYHIVDRNVQGYNLLTVKEDAGINTALVNPTEWYTTLLPYTMVKVERLTVQKFADAAAKSGEYYLNRRYDAEKYFEQGSHVEPEVASPEGNDSENGRFFYIDKPLKFDNVTRNTICNTRIRLDFSTLFPEIQSNNLRMSGKLISGSNNIDQGAMNYYLPDGYLDNVKMNANTRFIYWYPKSYYYSMNGDEFDAQGEFEITFNLPPVPFTSEWQVRLGCAPMNPNGGDDGDNAANRGQIQIYIDGKAEGLPLDFSRNLADLQGVSKKYFRDENKYSTIIKKDDEKRQEDFKALKNKGYYRGPYSVFTSDDGKGQQNPHYFSDLDNTVRKVLATVRLEAGVTHTITLKNVSTVLPKKKEAMLDYLEIVPKSVWGITEGDDVEDDL